jgi:glycerophosphoryl diester phosphodiesterase
MPTLWNQIENAGMKDNCVIISFQQCYIRWFAQNHAELNAEHRLQMLVDNYVDPSYSDNNTPYQDLVNGSWHGEGIKYDVSLAGDETAYLNTSYPHLSITKDMIDYTHANGRKFAIWTVDIQSHANDYMRWGVDYITTDYWKLVNSINDLPPAINWQ